MPRCTRTTFAHCAMPCTQSQGPPRHPPQSTHTHKCTLVCNKPAKTAHGVDFRTLCAIGTLFGSNPASCVKQQQQICIIGSPHRPTKQMVRAATARNRVPARVQQPHRLKQQHVAQETSHMPYQRHDQQQLQAMPRQPPKQHPPCPISLTHTGNLRYGPELSSRKYC